MADPSKSHHSKNLCCVFRYFAIWIRSTEICIRHVFRDFYRIWYFQISVLNLNEDAWKSRSHRLNSKSSKTPQNERHEDSRHLKTDKLKPSKHKTDIWVPRARDEKWSWQRVKWAPNSSPGWRKQTKNPRAYSIHEGKILQRDVYSEADADPCSWHFIVLIKYKLSWWTGAWVYFCRWRILLVSTATVFQRQSREETKNCKQR